MWDELIERNKVEYDLVVLFEDELDDYCDWVFGDVDVGGRLCK